MLLSVCGISWWKSASVSRHRQLTVDREALTTETKISACAPHLVDGGVHFSADQHEEERGQGQEEGLQRPVDAQRLSQDFVARLSSLASGSFLSTFIPRDMHQARLAIGHCKTGTPGLDARAVCYGTESSQRPRRSNYVSSGTWMKKRKVRMPKRVSIIWEPCTSP